MENECHDPSKKKTVLVTFDIDGTLIHSTGPASNKLHRRAFSYAFLDVFGVEGTIDAIQHHGQTDPGVIVNTLVHYGIPSEVATEKLPILKSKMVEYATKHAKDVGEGLEVLPGVEPLLQALSSKDNITIGLVTGNLEEIAWMKMDGLGLKKYFTSPNFGGFGSDHTDRGQLVKIAAERAGKLFPVKFDLRVHVGDTPNDIRAAEFGGALAVGVCTGIFSKEELEQASNGVSITVTLLFLFCSFISPSSAHQKPSSSEHQNCPPCVCQSCPPCVCQNFPPSAHQNPPPSANQNPPPSANQNPPPPSVNQNSPPSANRNPPPSANQNPPPPSANQNSPPSANQNPPPSAHQNPPPPSANQNSPPSANQNPPPSAHQNPPPSANQNPPPSANQNPPPPSANQNSPPSAHQNPPPSANQNSPPSANQNPPPSANQNPPPSAKEKNVYKNCFSKIFAFGDSFTDTGNAKAVGDLVAFGKSLTAGSPYGSSFFQDTISRFCDGRLIIDFLAECFDLPYIPAYKNSSADFSSGCNFAIAGSTVFDSDYYVKNRVGRALKWKEVPVSLKTQIDWFNEHLKQVECKGKDANACKAQMGNSLCWIGEMGGSDYSRTFGPQVKVESITEMAVDHVCKLLKALLDSGAKYIVVQGLPPSGCLPLDMSLAPPFDHDEIGCAGSVNSIIKSHNDLLQKKVNEIRTQYPGCMILFADFWGAFATIIKNPMQYGFEETFKACCGSPSGPFNFDSNAVCGSSDKATKCGNPAKHINWDGVHLTEAMYQNVANLFFNQGFCKPSFSELVNAKRGGKAEFSGQFGGQFGKSVQFSKSMQFEEKDQHKSLICSSKQLMASTAMTLTIIFFFIIISSSASSSFASTTVSGTHVGGVRRRFTKMYAFGNSYTDTGNTRSQSGPNGFNHVSSPPYGITFFHHPTNRYSDGRLVIDFVTETLSLPYLPPYLNRKADTSHGVNFAVAGSTAINHDFFVKNNITYRIPTESIQIQLGLFKKFLESHGCRLPINNKIKMMMSKECRVLMEDALFWVGEIGANDYAYIIGSSVSGSTIQELAVKSVTGVLQTSGTPSLWYKCTRGVSLLLLDCITTE
ncbi:Lipase [Macleaya cordata]|uniref:Lipase n=1 Tax=Macleaya cordata TaxID=56857 RepID=A0A200RCV9_MACCD|nr:Lipase [Macleaya cordata]